MTVDYLAVLIAGIAGMAVGALWYSPLLFGKLWMNFSGMTDEQMSQAKAKGMGKRYAVAFIFQLITAYVLAHFIALQSAGTLSLATSLVFWTWLGFVVPVMIGSILWENKSFRLFVLNASGNLVALLVMAIVLVLVA